MKRIKLFEQFINEYNKFTGDEVAQHIEDITPDESDIPDYFIDKFIKPNNGWELKQIKLKDLLKDRDFKDYYNSGEERYDEYEVDPNDLYNDLVVYKGKLLDGYSRASKMLRDGEKTAGAYVLESNSTNESVVNEAEKAKGDRGPLKGKGVETGLKNKAKESGVPLELLRLVMRRGMDAWNSSHYEGMTQEGWGYARVNAFLEKGKGTWGGADKDIAKEVRDGGHDKKLPYKSKD